jgi:uncharacterized membrane protein SirB2
MLSISTALFIHKISAVIAIFLFFIRGIGHIFNKPFASAKLLKVFPHLIYTLILISAFTLVYSMQISFSSDWVLAKFVALFGLIVFGVLAFKKTFDRKKAAIFWVLGLLCLFYLVSVSKTKMVWPF